MQIIFRFYAFFAVASSQISFFVLSLMVSEVSFLKEKFTKKWVLPIFLENPFVISVFCFSSIKSSLSESVKLLPILDFCAVFSPALHVQAFSVNRSCYIQVLLLMQELKQQVHMVLCLPHILVARNPVLSAMP